MIRKLKWKFVAIMMTIVTIMLIIIFAILFYSTKSGYERRSIDALHSIITSDLDYSRIPGGTPRRDPILIVDVDETGAFTVVKYGPEIENNFIAQIVDTARENDQIIGEIKDMYLRYMHGPSRAPAGTRYVFIDTLMEHQALHWQIIYSAFIGAGAFIVLFLISVGLSNWVARPVEEAWNRQRQFVADASHELKTPLTVILANTKIIADSHEITGQKNLTRLDNIGAEAARMKFLIESMLILARSDAGVTAATLSPVNFSFLAEQTMATFEPIFFEAGKEISYHIREQVQVNGDEKRLMQLIGILLDNACKYSRPGSVIDVSLTTQGGRDAVFSVTSKGTPLTDADAKRIFDRFYRLSPSRGEVPGYGLGLSIARNIVDEHKGRIWAQSDGKENNSFIFQIPVYRGETG